MEWERVQVFISSTFRDMHAERDYLVKHVFPALSEWCAARRLLLVDVDLRWGVTTRDSQTKKTVGVCLWNIDRCKPFFLCFLGQRRGWVPGEGDIDPDTRSRYQTAARRAGKSSVTEMEVEHALLAEQRLAGGENAARTLFYIRDGDFVPQLNDAQRRIYTNEAELLSGGEDAVARVARADAGLKTFCARIRRECAYVRDYHARWDPDEVSCELLPDRQAAAGRLVDFTVGGHSLGDDVLAALQSAISAEFPDREPVDGAEDPAAQRRLFMERAAEGYLRRPPDVDALEAYVSGPDARLAVLCAPSGAGKTMLLSHCALRWREEARQREVLCRFCGAAPDTATAFDVWKGLLADAGLDAGDSPEALRSGIGSLLETLARKDRVLLIDGADQIPDGVDMLRWLPRRLPEGLRLIVSVRQESLPEAGPLSRQGLLDSGACLLTAAPFDSDADKRALIDSYLDNYLKRLDPEEETLLCGSAGAQNPLFIKLALSELRVFGVFERLSQRITQLGDTPESAFDAMLARMEQDAAAAIPPGTAVPLLFSLLAASRYGLSEAELAGAFQQKLPDRPMAAILDTIRLYLRQVRPFTLRSGALIDLRYSSVRAAAAGRYRQLLPQAHGLLAGHFRRRLGEDFSAGDSRAFSELGYHTLCSGQPGWEAALYDYRYWAGKLRLCGVSALLFDLRMAAQRPDSPGLRPGVIADVASDAARVLRRWPEQLPSQLWGRLHREEARPLLDGARENVSSLWLRTLRFGRSAALDISSDLSLPVTAVTRCGGSVFALTSDGVVSELDGDSGEKRRTLTREGPAARCLTQGEGRLHIGYADGLVRVLTPSGGEGEEYRLPGAVNALLPMEQGLLAACQNGWVYLLAQGAKMRKLTWHRGGAMSLCLSGAYVFSGGRDEQAAVLRRDSLRALRRLRPCTGYVTALAAGEDTLAVGGYSESVTIYDTRTWKRLRREWTMGDAFTLGIRCWQRSYLCVSGLSARLIPIDEEEKLQRPGGPIQTATTLWAQGEDTLFGTGGGLLVSAGMEKLLRGCQQLDTPRPVFGVAANDECVCGITRNGGVVLLDRDSGEKLEGEALKNRPAASVCAVSDKFLIGLVSGQIWVAGKSIGQQELISYNDPISVSAPDIPVETLCTDNRRYMAYQRYGAVHTIDLTADKYRPKALVSKHYTAMACRNGILYCGEGSQITVFDLGEHRKCGETDMGGRYGPIQKLLIDDNILYILTGHGVVCMTAASGSLTSPVVPCLRADGPLNDLAVRGSLLVTCGDDQTLRLWRDGECRYVHTLDDVPLSLCVRDGLIYVGVHGGGLLFCDVENPGAPGPQLSAAPAMRRAEKRGAAAPPQRKAAPEKLDAPGRMLLPMATLLAGLLGTALELWVQIAGRKFIQLAQPQRFDVFTVCLTLGLSLLILSGFLYAKSLSDRSCSRRYGNELMVLGLTLLLLLTSGSRLYLLYGSGLSGEALGAAMLTLQKRGFYALLTLYPASIYLLIFVGTRGRLGLGPPERYFRLYQLLSLLAALILVIPTVIKLFL